MTDPVGVSPDSIIGILAAATPADKVKQRQGPGGRTLDYVDARYVMDKLDELGPENWACDHRIGDGGKVAAGIGIFVRDIGWVWKWDGAGETDIEGEKGSFSDSFKRAGVKWGIARDLYGDHIRAAAPTAAQAARPATPQPVAPADPAVVQAEAARIFADDVAQPKAGDPCPKHPTERLRGGDKGPSDLYHKNGERENGKAIWCSPYRAPRAARQ